MARAELFCSWSGGKDSCLALHRATADGARARCLITAIVEHGGRSRVRAGRRVLRDGCWFPDLAPAA